MILSFNYISRFKLPAFVVLIAFSFLIIASFGLQDYAILLPIVLLCLWAWVALTKVNCALALLILVIFNEELYRINTFGLGPRVVADMAILLIFSIIIINSHKLLKRISANPTLYMAMILLYWLSIGMAVYFGSYIIFNQPVSFGIIPARKYLIFGIYFFLIAVGVTKKDIICFFKYLAWWGGVLALLGITDSLLGGDVIFKEYHQIGSIRAGNIRVAVGTFNVCFSIIYSLAQLFHDRHRSAKFSPYWMLLLICLFNLIFISMTRASIIGVTITIAVMVVMSRRDILIPIVITIGILLPTGLLSLPFLSQQYGYKHLEELVNSTKEDVDRDEGNVSIRKAAAQSFYEVYKNRSPLVGIGLFSNDRFPENPIVFLSETYGYNLVDVNGLETLVRFGIPGVVLMSFFVIRTFRDSYMLSLKQNLETSVFGQIVFALLLYVLVTPTLGNIIVERMLVYTGIVCYAFDLFCGRLRRLQVG